AGCLSLFTGAFIGLDAMSTPTVPIYDFMPGAVTITGTTSAASGTLFTAPFLGPVAITYNTATNSGSLQGNLGPGSLAPALAAALFGSATTTGGVGSDLFIDFRNVVGSANHFTADLTQNQYQVFTEESGVTSTAVPEPGT